MVVTISSTSMSERSFDVIVWGATGFVGRIITEYIADKYTDSNVKFAIAGRNEEKLKAMVDEIVAERPSVASIPILTGDLENFNELTKQTRVLISCAGPFARIGEPVVKACVEEGTHYVDSTGEFHWVRKMRDTYGQQAQEKGLKIISCCGFDSVPFDLNVFTLQEAALAAGLPAMQAVHCLVTELKGGLSGGTINSVVELYESTTKEEREQFANDNFLVAPEQEALIGQQPEPVAAGFYNEFFEAYSSSFVMTSCNSKIVKWAESLNASSHAHPADAPFEYREGEKKASFLSHKSNQLSSAFKSFLLSNSSSVRQKLAKANPPGTGPSREAMAEGHFKVEAAGYPHSLTGNSSLLPSVTSEFSAKGDPGYLLTARMIVEAALSILDILAITDKKDEEKQTEEVVEVAEQQQQQQDEEEGTSAPLPLHLLPTAYGVVPPGAAIGSVYVDRLRAIGFTIEAQVLSEDQKDLTVQKKCC